MSEAGRHDIPTGSLLGEQFERMGLRPVADDLPAAPPAPPREAPSLEAPSLEAPSLEAPSRHVPVAPRAAPDDPVVALPSEAPAPQPREQPGQHRVSRSAARAPEALTAEELLRPRRTTPASGWRRWVFRLTGGLVDPGPSARELEVADLTA